ncbi:MAG: HAD family hydrolase [Promethearchaeota archaeon]
MNKKDAENVAYSNYCVIFDMDGVLADTGEIHYKSWVKLAKEIGVEFTKDFFNETFGQQSPTILKKLLAGKMYSDEKIIELANKKEEYYRIMVKDRLKPLPGAIELIKELRKKQFKLAIGSSGPVENVNLLVETLNIKHYFDVIITSANAERSKPAPDVFLKAAEKLNILPKNCVVIEDAPVGIEAARNAAMHVIALTTTHNKEELKNAELIQPDLSFISVQDIIKLFNNT